MSYSGLDEDDLWAVLTGEPSPERDEAVKRLVVEAFEKGWEACAHAMREALGKAIPAAAERPERVQ